jgi:hypothetical protein
MNGSDRIVLAIGGGILAIVIVAVAVVLAAGEPDVTDYSADTPEGTVQRYLRAAYNNDDEAVRDLLTERAIREMGSGPITGPYCQPSDGHQVRIGSVNTEGDRSTIQLEIENVSGSGLGFDRYSWDRSVLLRFENDGWKIDEPYFCV